ncbi:putative TonB-dependent receptor [Klebsiella pneumoniae]|uniref:Putative TonB-dependent receptor n=1 Tax=Klebsiella pneumoniae TaxID=573 RepID=A0A447S278_KLEPN|nr:putative TonB-dependent receptor [Klebsiella pneumoniae]
MNLGYAAQVHTDATAWRMSARNPTTNIYDNHDVAMPDNAYFGGNYHDPLVTSRSRTQGWLLSDTLGFFNDKVLFTAAGSSSESGCAQLQQRHRAGRYLFALYPKPLDADVWPGVQAVGAAVAVC